MSPTVVAILEIAIPILLGWVGRHYAGKLGNLGPILKALLSALADRQKPEPAKPGTEGGPLRRLLDKLADKHLAGETLTAEEYGLLAAHVGKSKP